MENKTAKSKLHKPPIYYVRKRLFQNYPAVFGLFVILIAFTLATLGYTIMPDRTPDAAEQIEQIQKEPMGFSVEVLNLRRDMAIEHKNFFEWWVLGHENFYKPIPIKEYRLDEANLTIYVKKYGEGAKEIPYSLVDVTEPLFIGSTNKIDEPENYKIEGDRITYVDFKEDIVTTNKQEVLNKFKKNGIEKRVYYLGTDHLGRDMLSRLLLGVRISLGIGFVSVIISLSVGITLGSLAGFFGGKIDDFIMWFMTVVWSIPGIMLVIAISLAFQSRGVWVAFVAVGLTTWVEIARVVRGQILSIKEKLYVEAARSLGMRSLRIIYLHILPNIIGPLIVIATSNFATAILIEAGLSFLGLGVKAPTPSWGIMVSEGFGYRLTDGGARLILLPSLCISLMVLAFNLFGNGLRDAYDPNTLTK